MTKIGLTSSMDDLDRLLDEAERTCSGSGVTTKKHIKALSNDEDSLNDDVSRILEEFNCPPTRSSQEESLRSKSASQSHTTTTSTTVAKKLRFVQHQKKSHALIAN